MTNPSNIDQYIESLPTERERAQFRHMKNIIQDKTLYTSEQLIQLWENNRISPDPETRIRDLRAQLNAQADQIERLSEAVKVLGQSAIDGLAPRNPGTTRPLSINELRTLFGIGV